MPKQQLSASQHRANRTIWIGVVICGLAGILLWLGAWPWSSYIGCGTSKPATLPDTVRIGLYEEFPTAQRLEKLSQLDFPVRLAVATSSRDEFLQIRETIEQTYPQVQEVFFWPLLTLEEGYYPGTWSDTEGIARLAREADGLPTLWDMEWPRQGHWFPGDWQTNRTFLDQWLEKRTMPVHIWRPHSSLGLDSRLLSLAGMHFDPRDYSMVSLHLDMYTLGQGLPDFLLERMLRCGVEEYGERFIPSFGVLDDQEGAAIQFIPVDTLRRYLTAARRTGVSEVWLFGSNGLNAEYLAAIHETLPLAPLPVEVIEDTKSTPSGKRYLADRQRCAPRNTAHSNLNPNATRYPND